MTIQILVFLFLIIGAFIVLDIPLLPKFSVSARIRTAIKHVSQERDKPVTAKAFVDQLNGTEKQNLFVRSKQRAKQIFLATGQEKKYIRTLKISFGCAVMGAAAGLLFRNILLAIILGCGLYFIPLWISKFSLYRYNRVLSDELELALSFITSAYVRTGSLLDAVKENLPNIHHPVAPVFETFVYNLEFLNPDIDAEIERMQRTLDHKIFHQWCSSLILAQKETERSSKLMNIVDQFALSKQLQMENDTKMMLPLKQAQAMSGIVVGLIPGFRLLNADWYYNLMHTMPGHIVLAITAVSVFVTLNRAIELSEPIEFNM